MRAIDADEMIKRLQEWNTNDAMDKALYDFTMHRILEQPTIEPERKTGKWNRYYKMHSGDTFVCNRCGSCFVVLQGEDKMNICPNCGSYNGGENEV